MRNSYRCAGLRTRTKRRLIARKTEVAYLGCVGVRVNCLFTVTAYKKVSVDPRVDPTRREGIFAEVNAGISQSMSNGNSYQNGRRLSLLFDAVRSSRIFLHPRTYPRHFKKKNVGIFHTELSPSSVYASELDPSELDRAFTRRSEACLMVSVGHGGGMGGKFNTLNFTGEVCLVVWSKSFAPFSISKADCFVEEGQL